jgi:purine-nucleoside phosphorylase
MAAIARPFVEAYEEGTRSVVITAAVGGIDPLLCVGDIVLVDGVIGVLVDGWIASDRSLDAHLPCATRTGNPVSRGLNDRLERAMGEEGIAVRRGHYAAVLGPSYETRAEIRMLRRFGGSVVGMSVAADLEIARRLGMRAVVLALVTNRCSDTERHVLSHNQVVTVGERASKILTTAVEVAVDLLSSGL